MKADAANKAECNNTAKNDASTLKGNRTSAVSKPHSSLLKSGLALSLATLLSRLLGLVREMTKAAFLGTGALADAFGIAFQLPNLFRRLFAENSVSVAFIPTFRATIEAHDDSRTQEFVSATLTLVTFLTAAVTITGMAASPLLIRLFYGSSDASSMGEAVLLTRIMFPYLVVVSVAALFQGILNGENVFAPSGFAPVLFNSCVITFTYLLAPHMENSARAMSVGVMIGGAAQAAWQLPFVLRTKWRVSFASVRRAFTDRGTRRVMSLVGPTIIGMAAYQVNDIVSSALAKRSGIGVYSALQYSLRLQELVLGIFAVSVGSVILPNLSAYSARRQAAEFSSLLSVALKIVTAVTIPVTFFSLVCGKEIVSLVYRAGGFDDVSVRMTAAVFRFHIAGLAFIALSRILSPAFYAQGNTALPTMAGIANFAVNIALASALVHRFGGGGIAFALSAASAVNMVFLLFALPKLHLVSGKEVALPLALYAAKIALFSLAAAAAVYPLRAPLFSCFAGHTKIISLGVPLVLLASIFAAVGVLLLAISRDEIIKRVRNR